MRRRVKRISGRRIRDVEKSARRKRTKISRVKTKYIRPTKCQDNIYMLRERVATVDSFSYLGSTIQTEGGCGKDVTNRVRAGWNRWREMSGVICDKNVPEVLTNKIYKNSN